MAFPRLNAVAFWMVPPGGILLLCSFFVGAPQAGWTSYPPLSIVSGVWGEEIWILSVLLLDGLLLPPLLIRRRLAPTIPAKLPASGGAIDFVFIRPREG